ncbi:hypothetical protein [Pyxidicoccus sp. MSG2]|uniref:hypothetical protein n=1 Tax=Pyxidicoccus sp. MSG2 TaxID=2996790 RepID=UPI00226F4385|nr:hypothetical protein [Pyxidicoccus sp. MSG2]MCY1018860.1 hypothetical protein [Pyxidicoccus sp. MSG2]
MRGFGLVAASLLVASGCVPEAQLRPSTGAQLQQGDADVARTEVSGVVLLADGTAWKGTPADLERSLTPVRVLVDNHSGRPLRLQYSDFAIVGAESRFQYAAVPPLELSNSGAPREGQGQGGSGSGSLYMGGGPGWGYGPYGSYRPFYGHYRYGYGPYGGPPGPFVGPYSPYYPYYGGYGCAEPLPTKDMLEQALPEGTLADGGRVEGFLYFQGVAQRERQVVLQARLVDGNTGEPFGTLDIPFQVQKH